MTGLYESEERGVAAHREISPAQARGVASSL